MCHMPYHYRSIVITLQLIALTNVLVCGSDTSVLHIFAPSSYLLCPPSNVKFSMHCHFFRTRLQLFLLLRGAVSREGLGTCTTLFQALKMCRFTNQIPHSKLALLGQNVHWCAHMRIGRHCHMEAKVTEDINFPWETPFSALKSTSIFLGEGLPTCDSLTHTPVDVSPLL